jgi:arylamine N-acetyltransferase
MINIVTIQGQRYLVDVGFGPNGPSHPLPLVSGHEAVGIPPQGLKLEYRSLPRHTDPSQRVWVFSHREDEHSAWIDAYAFTEVEFFPEDYEVMNLHTMTQPQSYFTQSVICEKVLLNEETSMPEGVLILHDGELRRRIGAAVDFRRTLETEEQRHGALEEWFGIVLSEEEKRGIWSLATELRGGLKA